MRKMRMYDWKSRCWAAITILAFSGVLWAQTPKITDYPDLARRAMLSYLKDRSTPSAPQTESAAVCVTLRHEGNVIGRAYASEGTAGQNTIRAAQQAMRSPGLPNIVHSKYIRSLVVEVAIFGAHRPVSGDMLNQSIVPGLTGLRLQVGVSDPKLSSPNLARAYQETQVLPSTEYVLGLTSEAVIRYVVADVAVSPALRGMKKQWSLFNTVHYVGYPNRPVMLLYRGKRLDAKLNAAQAVEVVDNFLQSRQGKSGRLSLPAGLPTTVGQLRTALFWSATGVEDDQIRAKALFTALAPQILAFDDKKNQVDVHPQCSIREAAMLFELMIVLNEHQRGQRSEAIFQGLKKWLQARMDEGGRLTERGGKPASAQAALATMCAFRRAGEKNRVEKLMDRQLLTAGLVTTTSRPAEAYTPTADIWAELGMTLKGMNSSVSAFYLPQVVEALLGLQVDDSAPLDAAGGIIDKTGRPGTLATARALKLFQETLPMIRAKRPDIARQMTTAIPQMRKFCIRQIYLSGEAFFAEQPKVWDGAVRKHPAWSDISLEVGVAVLEALSR